MSEAETKRPEEEYQPVANLDEIDFLTLLMESRIIDIP